MALLRKNSGSIVVIVLLLLAGWGLRVLSGAAPPPSQSVSANAGLPQLVSAGATVRLDASRSTSPTGAPLQYQWSFLNVPNGSSAELNNPASINPRFVVDQAGSYVVQLNVSDGVTSSTSQVVISTQATPPIASAGPNQFISAGSVVHLDAGGSNDPDGDPLSFQWSLVGVPAGSQASISNPAAIGPTFFADVPGTYLAQVTVSDTHGNDSTSTVTISTQNAPPTASAGPTQSVTLGTTVQLDGSASADPNGDQISYFWNIIAKPAASAASLSATAVAKPTFVADVAGSYVAQLAVSDNHGNVSLATVEITTDAIPPVANAGADQAVNVGSTVQLSGVGSIGSGSLGYQWNLLAKPSGSRAALAGGGSSSTSLIADLAGQYLVQLQVSDGVFTSAPSTVLITAAAAGPNLIVSPSPVNFGAQAVGATSNPVGVTITNLGTTSVQVTSFLLVGLNGSEFTIRGLNSTTLAPNSAFIFSVLFTPQAQGTRTAALIVNDNSGGLAHLVTLSGVGGTSSPNFSSSPASLTFAGQAVGTTSASLSLTVTNTGNAPLQITGLGFGGSNAADFALASTFTVPTSASPITLAANGGSTNIPVVFKPTALGSRAATLIIIDNAPGSPQAVPLNGTGVSGQSGTINVTPASIAFADQAVGSGSAPSPVTVTNSGTSAVQITALTFSGANSGDFSTTAIAPVTVLANGATATIPVTFTPTAAGSRSATLTITDNSGGNAHVVALSGNGTSPPGTGITVPASLNFPNQALNTTASLPLTVSNTGGTTVSVTGMLLAGTNAGDFNISGSRTFSLLPGSSNTVNVLFTPQALGPRTATIIIFDNSGGTAHAVTLNGIGGNSPAIQLSPSSLTFPNQAVGATSLPQTVTVTNTGNAALQITGLGFAGSNPADFGFSGTFTAPTPATPLTVAANGGVTSIPVVFKPTASGTRSASLVITDNASGSPHSVGLSGTAGPGAGISVTPASIAFPDQAVSGSSAPFPVTVTNAGATAVQVTALTFSGNNAGDFSTTATAPITVAANGGTAIIPVTFTPTAAGSRAASLTIADNSGGSSHTVSLSGNTTTGTGVLVSPTSLDFQNQGLKVTASLPVTVSNNSSATVSVTGMLLAGLSSSDFNVGGARSFSVPSGANVPVNVLFTPQAQGPRSATLIINNTSVTALTVSLLGTGVVAAPDILLSPTSLPFPNQAVGTTSAPLSVTATNTGNAPLQITGLTFSGSNPGDFALAAGFSLPTPAAPITVAPNGTTSIPVVFKPTASGQTPRTTTLVITDNASGSPHAVSLNGTGTAPNPVFSPNPVGFGNQNLKTTSSASSITVTNTGNGALQITGLTFGGTNAGDFALPASFTAATQSSPITVAPNGGTATIPVVFAPTAFGPRTATLQFTDNATPSPQSVTLTGTGVGPTIVFNPSAINFGPQMQSVASAVFPFTVSNTGNADLQITGISITDANAADFSFPAGFTAPTPASPMVVTPGGVQNLGAIFTPSATGTRTATVNFADNAPSSPQPLALTGNGILPIAALSPNPVPFPNQATGTPSAPVVVTVTNSGTAPLAITSFSFTGTNASDFSTSTAPMTVSPNGGTGNIAVIFTPSAIGARTAILQVNDNAIPPQQTATLNGTGVGAPIFSPSPASLNFGTQQDNVPSTALPLNISNPGTADLVISSLTLGGTNAPDFGYSIVGGGVLPQTIAPGGNLVLNVIFTPATGGSRTASLIFTDNASGSPQSVGLFGIGTATPPTATLSTSILTFSPQPLNTTSSPLTMTITNTGQTDLSVSSISFSGANASEFRVTPAGPFTVAKNGGVTTLSVTFTPTGQDARAGTMTIVDNAPNSPQTVSVSGTGRGQGQISLAPLSLGGNLETLGTGSLDVAPTSPLPVTITSSDTSKVLLVPISTDPTGVTQGTGQITGTVPAGQGRFGLGFPGFWVQAVASSGTAQITITAPGYLSGTATVTLTPSGFVLNSTGPGANFTATLGANSPLTVSPVQLDASGNVLSTSQKLRGGVIANVTVSSGTTATGTVTGNPAVLQPGAVSSSIVTFQPKAVGTSLLSIAQPSGYSAPNTGTQLTVTVITPAISLNPILVGFNQQTLGIGRLAQAPTSSLTVTLTSSDPSKVLLSTSPTAVGTGSIGLHVAAGATALPAFYVQALDSSGTVTLTAIAAGYAGGTGNVGLLASAFLFSTSNGVAGDFATTTISPATGLTVALWQLDSSLRPLSRAQLRPGISASVAVTSGTPSAGTVVGSPAVFNGGDSSNNDLSFQPAQSCNAPCTTLLSVTQPSGFSTPASGGQLTVTVNQPSISLRMVTTTVGGNLEAPASGALDAPAPSNLPVTITSNNPNVLLSNCQQILGCTGAAATDVGSQSILVVVPVGNGVNSVGFPNYYVQALANSGTATLTASAPGFTSGSITVTLAPAGFVISGPNGPGGSFGTQLGNGSVTLTVSAVVLDAGLAPTAILEPVRGGFSAAVAVTSDSPAAVVTGSPVLVGGGNTSAPVILQLQSRGVAGITIATPSGFTTPSLGNQLSMTIN